MVAGIILVNKKNMDWFSSCVAHIADAADMVSVVCEDDIVIESEDIKSFSDYSDALIYAKQAGAKWILSLDADMRIEHNFIKNISRYTKKERLIVFEAEKRVLCNSSLVRYINGQEGYHSVLYYLPKECDTYAYPYPSLLDHCGEKTDICVYCFSDIEKEYADAAFIRDHEYKYFYVPENYKTYRALGSFLKFADDPEKQVVKEENKEGSGVKQMLKLAKERGFKSAVYHTFFNKKLNVPENEKNEYKKNHKKLHKLWRFLVEYIGVSHFNGRKPVYSISKEELVYQRSHTFEYAPKISVAVPLYNTPPKFFKELVESLFCQTYSNWELCLADGSTKEDAALKKLIEKYTSLDKRIVYKKLGENAGIAGNSNAALQMATGEYVALLDHDDLYAPDALYEVVKAINDHGADFIYSDEATFRVKNKFVLHAFKPDFSPDTLRGVNYICHLCAFKKELLDSVGAFREGFEGSQDYDLFLRLTEKAKKIYHIPKVLYFWRISETSVASSIEAKPYCLESSIKALDSHLERTGLKGKAKEVFPGQFITSYKIDYEIKGEPKISILIPNKDHVAELKRCLYSIKHMSTYKNFEVIVIENNSTEDSIFEFYKTLECENNVKVVYFKGEFNYSAINNFGRKYAEGEYLLFLNNDIEVITPDWMEQMLMFAQRKDVGAVGAKLYYPDDTIQHAGVVVGYLGYAGHVYYGFEKYLPGYMRRLQIVNNYSSVTGACLLMRSCVFDEIDGFDEDLKVAYNDVDLCLKARSKGYLNVWTPFCEMYHYESVSRGYEDTEEKKNRLIREGERLRSKWPAIFENGDPYYNPNLTLISADFRIKKKTED